MFAVNILFRAALLFRLWRGDLPVWRERLRMKNIIRALRSERGLSQAALADQLGVSRQSVNAIETGKYDPSLPLAFAIARLFGKSIEEIFDDETEAQLAAE